MEIRRVAELAEELGFDSVWATEHIIVGPEAVDPYGRVYDPLVTLGWIAGWTQRIGLGTSIVLVPLHNPMHLAKEVATVQELSGGRFTLGVGMGCRRRRSHRLLPRRSRTPRLRRALQGSETVLYRQLYRFRWQPASVTIRAEPLSRSARRCLATLNG